MVGSGGARRDWRVRWGRWEVRAGKCFEVGLLSWKGVTADRSIRTPVSQGPVRRRPYDAAAPDSQHRSGRELKGRVNWSTSRKKTGCQEFHANSRTTRRRPVFTICAGTRRK
jgi:hypothetical protein